MRTVSYAVEEVMSRSPFLAEAIAEGITSTAKVARHIKPEVEKILYEKVSEESVAMALHRLGKHLKRPNFGIRFLKQISGITVRSGLVIYAAHDAAELDALVAHASAAARGRKDAFVNFSRGTHESLLILDRDTALAAARQCKPGQGIGRTERLSAITLLLPEESLAVPGLYYPILKALAMEGISFVEVMSVRTEFTLLFEEKDVDQAFAALKKITA